MKTFITGGSGFIGAHLLEELIMAGHSAISLDWRETDVKLSGVEYILLDFSRYDELLNVLKRVRPDVVCHLGAVPSVQTSIRAPMESVHSNISGLCSVLEASRVAGVKRVVFASSAAVYGTTGKIYSGKPLFENLPLDPVNPYGLQKKYGEEMMKMWVAPLWQEHMDTVSLRFFNVFGPRQKRDSAYATAIERFLHQRHSGEPLTIVPDGTQRRDMVFVGDVVRAIRLAVEARERFEGEVINIGSGTNYSILEIADIIGGSGYARTFIDPRPGEVKESLADISKAKKLLKWKPEVSFKKGIELLKIE